MTLKEKTALYMALTIAVEEAGGTEKDQAARELSRRANDVIYGTAPADENPLAELVRLMSTASAIGALMEDLKQRYGQEIEEELNHVN